MSVARLELDGKHIALVGTAHVSRDSVEEVRELIRTDCPDVVCVELDQSRHKALVERESFEKLDIIRVLRDRKGFLLLANLVLASFQRRIGVELGVRPGQEMLEAITLCTEMGIPYLLSDRDIQITLRRAWARSGFWAKNKMLAAMLSSVFVNEKIDEAELAKLKEKNVLQGMLEELSTYLPSVKEVLIDERDRYLAAKIFSAEGDRVVAVLGAGHVEGVVRELERLSRGASDPPLSDLETVPPRGLLSRLLPWFVPAAILALIAVGFFRSGWELSLSMMWKWVLVNGSLSAVGAAVALAHPVTIIAAFLGAPITSMNPTIGVGIVTGVLEASLRKPRVVDFENLHTDLLTVRGFLKNRFTHVFAVFFLSSLGSAIGTFIGVPFLTSLLR